MTNKQFLIFHGLFYTYGFTRGYRSFNMRESEFKKQKELREINIKHLFTEKVIRGFCNGMAYGLPIYNISMGLKLVNRLEISFSNLDKKNHISSYEELTGLCEDTI